MNSVETIVHKSRDISYKFDFTADSGDSWTFLTEGDLEIYAIESTNVDESTILIQSTTLVMPKILSDGIYYSVKISRLQEGLAASLTLKCRRAVDKEKAFSLSSLFKYDGRYAYCLEEFNGVVHKVDTELLKASNYEGAGIWTLNPIITSINLPVLPAEHFWSSIGFVKSNDREKIICISGKDGLWDYSGCFIYVDNNEVYDLLEENHNAYSTYYYNDKPYYSYPRYFLYDYINERVFFRTIAGSAGYTQVEYNLLTHEKINNGYSTPFSAYNTQYNLARLFFDPVRECFCEFRADVSPEQRLLNYKGNTVGCNTLYDIETGYTVGARFYTSGVNVYNQYGRVVAGGNLTGNLGIKQNGSGCVMLRKGNDRYYCAVPFNYDKTSFIYQKLYDGSFAWQDRVNDLIDSQSNFYQGSLCASNHSSLCLLLGISHDYLGKKRMHVIEPGLDSGNTITQRHLDFPNDLIITVTNQLLV